MDLQGFRNDLKERKLSEDEITASIALASQFEEFHLALGHSVPTQEDALAFSDHLIQTGQNTVPNFYALARYADFSGNHEVYTSIVDLLDGAEAMGNFHQKAEEILGLEKRDAIFEGVKLPPLGLPNSKKVVLNQKVMSRLEEVATPEESNRILKDSLRDLEDDWFENDKQLYRECSNLDEFLDKSAQSFIAMLENLRDEGKPFFTQFVTDDVVEYVRSEPLIARGVREGNMLYEVKIPHETIEFLAESEPQKKRYHYCHCPWVKESLKTGKSDIPSRFCDCSAGFHKKKWEVIFDQPLKAEIIESVLAGDDWCKIAIHLPEEVV